MKQNKKQNLKDLAEGSSPLLTFGTQPLSPLLPLRLFLSITNMTVSQLAEVLGTSASNVSTMLKRNDIKLSVIEKIFMSHGCKLSIELLTPYELKYIHIEDSARNRLKVVNEKRLSFLVRAIAKTGFTNKELGKDIYDRFGQGGPALLQYHLRMDDMRISWVYLYASIMGLEPYFTIMPVDPVDSYR